MWINKTNLTYNPSPNTSLLLQIDKVQFGLTYINSDTTKHYYTPFIKKLYFSVDGTPYRLVHIDITAILTPWYVYVNEENKHLPIYSNAKHSGNKYTYNDVNNTIRSGGGWNIPSAKVSSDSRYGGSDSGSGSGSGSGSSSSSSDSLGSGSGVSSSAASILIYTDTKANNIEFATFAYNQGTATTLGATAWVTGQTGTESGTGIGKYYNILQGQTHTDITVKTRGQNSVTKNGEFDIYCDTLTLQIDKTTGTIYWANPGSKQSNEFSRWELQPVHDSTITSPVDLDATRF